MSKWKPISTAPKDGTVVLVANFRRSENHWLSVCRFFESEQPYPWLQYSGPGVYSEDFFTHWILVPASLGENGYV